MFLESSIPLSTIYSISSSFKLWCYYSIFSNCLLKFYLNFVSLPILSSTIYLFSVNFKNYYKHSSISLFIFLSLLPSLILLLKFPDWLNCDNLMSMFEFRSVFTFMFYWKSESIFLVIKFCGNSNFFYFLAYLYKSMIFSMFGTSILQLSKHLHTTSNDFKY